MVEVIEDVARIIDNLRVTFAYPQNWQIDKNGAVTIRPLSSYESERIYIYGSEIPPSLRSSNLRDIIADFQRQPVSRRDRTRQYQSDNPTRVGKPPAETYEGRAMEYTLTSDRFGEGREIWVFVRKDRYLIDIELIAEAEAFQSFRTTIVNPFLESIRITRASS